MFEKARAARATALTWKKASLLFFAFIPSEQILYRPEVTSLNEFNILIFPRIIINTFTDKNLEAKQRFVNFYKLSYL